MPEVNVLEAVGEVKQISDTRLSKNNNEYRTIEILVKGFCWNNTTGLFEHLKDIKPGDRLRFYAEERKGFISIKGIIKENEANNFS